jgi:hypothetical protein
MEREQQPQDLICSAQLRLGGPNWEMFAATNIIVGGNRKTITATNLYMHLFYLGSYDQTVAENANGGIG